MSGKNTNFSVSVKNVFNFIEDILSKCGPRPSASKESRKAAEIISDKMESFCDNVKKEDFTCSPKAFLGFTKVTAPFYIVGAIMAFFLPFWASILFTFSGIILVGEYIFYLELLDPFYKKRKGTNVYATIEPEGEVKQQIIVGGHHDSAYEFNWIYQSPSTFGFRTILSIFTLFIVIIGMWIGLILSVGHQNIFLLVLDFHSGYFWFKIFIVITFVYMIPVLNFRSNMATPGAADNLSGSGIALELGRIISNAKNNGQSLLKNTRVIVTSFGGEEAGLRGSRSFVKKHVKELQNLKTYAITPDTIAQANEIKIFIRDLNGTQKMSDEIAQDLQSVGSKLDINLKLTINPLGSTDAASFAQKKIPAIGIISVSTNLTPKFYHTRYDTIDNIEENAIESIISLLYNYILKKDAEIK